jgi:formate hydrogenlyase subunit 6/NADH:ubiquinone oxidoreductase subunit I
MLEVRSDLSFDPTKCIGCEACAATCPRRAIRITKDQGFETISYTFALCLYCRRCSFTCPENAVKLTAVLEPASFSTSARVEEKLKIELQICERCGSAFAPKPMVTKIEDLIREKRGMDLPSLILLCPRCRTQILAGCCVGRYDLGKALRSQLEQVAGSHEAKH